MELIAKICMCVAAALCYCVQAYHFTHMFQLNSYRDERYARWCNENGRDLASPRRLFPALLLLVALAAAYWVKQTEILYFTAAGILLVAALLNLPKKAKKPLVITARVKRLFAAQGLILAALLTVGWFLPYYTTQFIWVGLVTCIVWFWVRAAGRIMAPIEKAFADRFIREARQMMADRPDLQVIGITGSYGKTSTKTFLTALLSVKYNVLMTPENYNTTLGVVRTIRERLKPSHQIFVCEMGAKQRGDIKEICDLVRPSLGVITSIGEQHLETFGSIDNIIKTKFELADALPAEGILFVNTDNAYIRNRTVSGRRISYGLSPADYTAGDIRVDTLGCHFTVTAPDGERAEFSTKLLGAHNIQNLVGCIAVAHVLGIPLSDLTYPVRLLKPVPHRLQLLPNGFIDDAYNSNPAGFRSALDLLSGFPGQRVLVTPGMVELGERQEALNRELGEYAAGKCDWAILVGLKQAPPLQEGLLAGGFDPARIHVAPTLQEALAFLNALPREGERTVLLENDLPDNF